MSKQQPEDAYLGGDGELPPPYSAEPTTTSSVHPDSLFAAHLAAMRLQIREQQAVRASQQDRRDTQLLASLVPHVEDLLASVARANPPPRLVQATLVPDGAVSPDWTLSDTDGGRSGEVHRVVRVQTRPAGTAKGVDMKQPEEGGSRAAEFDGWGRWGDDVPGGVSDEDRLWWKDENMAVRLAKYLQPARKTVAVAVDRPTVTAKVAEAKKARSRWNILGGGRSGGSTTPTTPPLPAASRPAAAVKVEDDVAMHVTAEEVTFRRENDMGIWESSAGWGVVVRVSIRT